MASSIRLLRFCVIALCFSPIVGCGASGPRIVPVEGTVKLDGKSLDKILVEFWPTTDGPRSFGETDSDGHFKLTTDDGKRDGASVGVHKVTLKDTAVLGGKFMGRKGEEIADMSAGRKSRIAGKFSGPDTSKLTVTIDASKKNQFDLEATAK